MFRVYFLIERNKWLVVCFINN